MCIASYAHGLSLELVRVAKQSKTHMHFFLTCSRCLTPDWLLHQMKYRYDREIESAERYRVCWCLYENGYNFVVECCSCRWHVCPYMYCYVL